MTKKRVILAVALIGFSICAALFVGHENTAKNISYTTFLRIRKGMTGTQVEGILGGPPRREARPVLEVFCGTEDSSEWYGAEGVIRVQFSLGTVADVSFAPHSGEIREPDLLTTFRTWLNRW
jgi:hypothetical protein